MNDLDAVEAACGYKFKDRRLLDKALTLSSYDSSFNNESLECLGDALLSFIVAEKYYFDNLSEGEITVKKQQLLSDDALRPVSERLGLDKALRRDKGDTANKKAVPSAYEAFVAAVYLDGGLDEAKKFALSTLTPLADKINYVAAVQEILQADGEQPPVYQSETYGSPRHPEHRVTVKVRGRVFTGGGENLKAAKRCAAQAAYEFLKDTKGGK